MIAGRGLAALRDSARIQARLATLKKEMPMSVTAAQAMPGHNSELTEEHRRALFFQHLGKIKKQKEALASVNADLRNAYKIAKAEGYPKKDIEYAISLEDADEEALLEERRRQAMIARWMQAPIGLQGDLLDAVDRAPAEERAAEAGKIAGMKGETCIAPYPDGGSDQAQAWIKGWHEGQGTLMAALSLTKGGVQDSGARQTEIVPQAEGEAKEAAPFGEDTEWPDDKDIADRANAAE